MNDAHFHLVINHMPIVGVLIGFLVLLSGYIIKSSQVKTTALGIFIFSTLTAIAAYYTGGGAENIVKNLPEISETLIHKHEELADIFFTMMLILGSASLLTLFFQFKKFVFVKYGYALVLLLSIGCVVISKYVGTSGGEITHIEIRSNANVIQLDAQDDHDDN
ncbi:hypothetical protein [Yeosuana marina]|uniref:hypothetical protein n=1 Tax=Yeosuana marina TaxID=1565536 RepID=UPI0030C82F69